MDQLDAPKGHQRAHGLHGLCSSSAVYKTHFVDDGKD